MNIFDLLDDTPPMIKPTRKRVPLTPPFNPGAKPQIPEIDLATLLASDDEAAKTQTRPRLVPPPREVAEEAIYIPDDVDENVNVSGGSGEPVTMPRPTLSPMQITPRPMEEEPRDPRSHVQLSPYDDINLSPLDYERKRLGKLTNLELNPVRNKEAQTIDPATGKPGKANFGGRLKDALREALIGAGQQVAANGGEANWGTLGAAAAGGIGGAIDPSMNEKRQRSRDIANSQGRVGELERQRATDQDFETSQINQAYKIEQTQAIPIKAALEAKKAEIQKQYNADRIALGKDKADDIRYWREESLRLRELGLTQQADQADRKIEETIRSNKAKEGLTASEGAANRASREKIAGMSQSGQNRRQAIALEARKTLEEYKAAQAAGRQQEAIAAREKLAQLKAEDDGLK